MGNCHQFLNQQQKDQQIVNENITVETTEQKQQPGFKKRPIGVHAPQFSGTCFQNGGLSQKSLKDYYGKYVIILFYSLEDQKTFDELITFENMYDQYQNKNCDIIIIIDDKLERIKSQMSANVKKIQNTNYHTDKGIHANQNETNGQIKPHQDQTSFRFGVFSDSEGKIFSNFKVPTTDSNQCYRYKAVYILDKLGIIQYLNIYNSNIRCDSKQIYQLLADILFTPLNKQLSLFERVGGARILNEAVELFYNELPQNPFLNEFFKNLNYRKMKNKQAEYLNYLFHLPISGQKDLKVFTTINGKNISDVHKNFQVPPNIYEIYVRQFNKIFIRLDVDQQTVQEIYERFQLIKTMIFPNLVNQKSTYELLGSSQDTITVFVDLLFNRLLADQYLGSFFKGTNLEKIKKSQKQFFALAFGGPSTYDLKALQDSHQHLRLNDHHFETFVECICESLKELLVPEDEIGPIKKQFQSIRSIFVNTIQQQVTYNALMQSSVYHSQHQQDTFQQTLYYRIGGKQVVDSILDIFKQKIINDPRVSNIIKFESGTNQVDIFEQFQIALGGQSRLKTQNGSMYSNQRSQINSSQVKGLPIKLTENQLAYIKQHLLSSARTFSIDFEQVVEIGQIYESLRGIAFYIIPQKTIYEQFGGENGVLSSVNIFYDKIQYDHRLNILFKTIPVQKQKDLFYSLISFCVGSPIQYDSQKMKQQTVDLHMRDIHFEGLEQNLILALRDMMQSEKDIQNSLLSLQTIKKDLIIPIGSLFDEIGGEQIIEQAVQRFYLKLMNHNTLKNLFQFLDQENHTNKLKTFLIQLFGGPQCYKGRNMSNAHGHLGLNDIQFDKFKVLMNQSFREVGVKNEIISKISFKIETLRKDIVDISQNKFDRLGGERFVNIAVDLFYQNVMRDERINFFFSKIDMTRQRNMMYHFLMMLLGGEQKYNGKNMKEAHQHLQLNNLHFDVIKANLMDTLMELDVDYTLIDQIANDYIEPLRKEIIIHVQSPNYNYF